MDRRGFVGVSLTGGTAVAAGLGMAGCVQDEDSSPAAADTPVSADIPGSADIPFEFAEATVADLQAAMESGEHTARSIAEAYLARIEALDGQGPELRSIIETNPDALAIADELDDERRRIGPRGPLHGIPIALKTIWTRTTG